jgi:hypothetical protein
MMMTGRMKQDGGAEHDTFVPDSFPNKQFTGHKDGKWKEAIKKARDNAHPPPREDC